MRTSPAPVSKLEGRNDGFVPLGGRCMCSSTFKFKFNLPAGCWPLPSPALFLPLSPRLPPASSSPFISPCRARPIDMPQRPASAPRGTQGGVSVRAVKPPKSLVFLASHLTTSSDLASLILLLYASSIVHSLLQWSRDVHAGPVRHRGADEQGCQQGTYARQVHDTHRLQDVLDNARVQEVTIVLTKRRRIYILRECMLDTCCTEPALLVIFVYQRLY